MYIYFSGEKKWTFYIFSGVKGVKFYEGESPPPPPLITEYISTVQKMKVHVFCLWSDSLHSHRWKNKINA